MANENFELIPAKIFFVITAEAALGKKGRSCLPSAKVTKKLRI
jgi:hypothetical protein